jgi:hypothetical protein
LPRHLFFDLFAFDLVFRKAQNARAPVAYIDASGFAELLCPAWPRLARVHEPGDVALATVELSLSAEDSSRRA